ncbi:hypothetical protein [Actinomadura chokoriensis]
MAGSGSVPMRRSPAGEITTIVDSMQAGTTMLPTSTYRIVASSPT